MRESVAVPNVHENGTYDQENVNLILQHFCFTCKTFTYVMAIKHQLQYSLFNGSYYHKNSAMKIDMKNFTLILEYLQMLASTLQDIEVCHTHKITSYLGDLLLIACVGRIFLLRNIASSLVLLSMRKYTGVSLKMSMITQY